MESHRIPYGKVFLDVTIGNKKYAKCSHQQANNAAKMQVHYTKCSMDSVSSASI